jgi:hypothetical protein
LLSTNTENLPLAVLQNGLASREIKIKKEY